MGPIKLFEQFFLFKKYILVSLRIPVGDGDRQGSVIRYGGNFFPLQGSGTGINLEPQGKDCGSTPRPIS